MGGVYRRSRQSLLRRKERRNILCAYKGFERARREAVRRSTPRGCLFKFNKETEFHAKKPDKKKCQRRGKKAYRRSRFGARRTECGVQNLQRGRSGASWAAGHKVEGRRQSAEAKIRADSNGYGKSRVGRQRPYNKRKGERRRRRGIHQARKD